MHNAKTDILALILAMVGLGLAVAVFNHFPDPGVVTWQEDETNEPFHPQKRGMQIARVCLQCHDLTRERKMSRNGPPLWGIMGQPAGAVHGFKYTSHFMEMAKTALPWSPETLDLFLRTPHPLLPDDGTIFAGIAVDMERTALIDYLATLKEKQDPLPQPLLQPSTRALVTANEADTPEQQVKRGRTIAEQCRACHDLTRDKKNIIGPYLWNVVGRQAGSAESFPYSQPFLAKTQQLDLRWTPHNLDQFLAAPQQFIPQTRMLFAGVKDQPRRADLIAYLQTLQ